MPESARRRELGRGERVLPGVWRLRLPLPWPGVPHCNAWAVAAGDGVVLVDCGLHEPGSRAHLERAMAQVGLALRDVRVLVCTHAHADHYGQAADVVDASGCELWMHADHAHMRAAIDDRDHALARRLEVARQSGVPIEPLRAWAAGARSRGSGIARLVEPDRELVTGTTIDTDVGRWTVHETPGHAPSHVCLHQPERRLLVSGDHLLGRVSLYFDFGWTPDPVGEFLTSLDTVAALDARLCLAGHGRTFADVRAHIEANRKLVAERLARVRLAVAEHGPITAYDVVPLLHGEPLTQATAGWWLPETLSYLRHLEVRGDVRRDGSEPERWAVSGIAEGA
ncbi:MAG TPA: MBL fold metallo-hydrolase [Solirubrobacteraceae bacterium]|nr:MBL fold metallo-hydrolase [Solirubrobacteraceae bacterium]